MAEHRPPKVATRTIPVAVAVPTQLPLGLRWDQPIEHVHAAPEPGPAAPVALPTIGRRAAA